MATYSETVLADAPLLYYQLNENPDVSAGGRNVVNSGSVGGNGVTTYSASGTMTKAASAPGYIGGTSLEFNNNQAYISQSSGTITSTKDFSIELWWKRNMGYAAASGTMTIGRWSGGSGGTGVFDISIGSSFSTPQILVSISNGSTYPINTTAVTNITDGNWHHLVVTYTTSDSKFRLYVDGALKSTSATTTTTANTTGTFYWGGVSTPGGDGWIDEAAFYNKTLTATQVANHYNAAMTVPTLNVTATPPAMTASMSAPAPTQYIAFDNTVAVPAMATSIATPDPIVTAQFVDSQIDIPTADRSTATGSGTAANITFHYSTGNSQIGFQFPTPTIPAGKRVQTATFKVYNNGSVTRPVAIRRATAAWSEGDTATFTSTATGAVSATLVPGWNSFDITAFVNLWLTGTSNYGVILSDAEFNFSAAATSIAAKENTDATLRPTLTTVREAIPAVNINVSAPVMAVSMAAPAPVITAQQNVSNVAPVAALELTAIGAGVLTSVNTISTAPVISAGVEFKGGTSFNPDYATTVPAMTLSLTSVNPNQKIEYVVNVAAPAIYLGNLENEIASVSLTTNRLVVAPVMNLSMKWPGIYVEQADRYISLLNSTLPNNGKESVWYKLGGEAVGATRITDATANTRMDGYVFGNPDFNVPDGPGLRKAAHFDGVDDYIVTGPYSNNGLYNNTQDIKANDHAVTIEFSIRTTQMNGTIFNATGGGNGGLASISPTYFAYPNITKRLKLKDGYLYVSDGGTNVKLRSGFISDGEWHHVVMSLGANAGPGIPADVQGKNYLMVDGKTVLVNYYISGGEAWTPYAFMADADFQGTAYESGNGGSGQGGPRPARGKNVTDYLAGDLRDVIVRLNTYVPELAATTAYYEWSDSTVVKAAPMTLNLTAVAPAKVKGNYKRMLAIYGMPIGYEGAKGMFTGGEAISAYRSKFSAFTIKSFENGKDSYVESDRTGWHRTGNMGSFEWQIPAVFPVGDFLVYPISIRGGGTGTLAGNLAGVPTTDGVVNFEDTEIDSSKKFVDFETGTPRFINLQEDLAEPVENYDAITVVNYPWVAPKGFPVKETSWVVPWTADAVSTEEFGLYQQIGNMTDSEWEVARDNFRDSLLEAAYNGVNLWIGEYHMAQHLGFIGTVDVHDAGERMLGYYGSDDFGALSTDSRFGANMRAQEIDDTKIISRDTGLPQPQRWNQTAGGYHGYPQINHWRRIVAEVPGLTDIPSNFISEMVEGWSEDEWRPNGSFLAYDIARRPNGLKVGDRMWMDVFFRYATSYDSQTESQEMTGFEPSKRRAIVSARPEGIVGRVISREADFYYGPATDQAGNYRIIDNPFKNNAYTIAAERGSVVRGRPIRGRVFIELMDFDAATGGLAEDMDKNLWRGSTSGNTKSTWDFDTRRYLETKIVGSTQSLKFVDGAIQTETRQWQYFQYETGKYRSYNTLTMHMRGLRWLALTPEVNGDDYVSYATPITVTISSPNPVFSRTRNPEIQVTGPMRLDLEVRQPANYRDGSVLERATAIELNLEMRGIGRTVEVPPMELAVSTVAPVIEAETEIVTVYLDNTSTATLFLKEDN